MPYRAIVIGVQDPETASVDSMSLVAIAETQVDYILQLEVIAEMWVQLFKDQIIGKFYE